MSLLASKEYELRHVFWNTYCFSRASGIEPSLGPCVEYVEVDLRSVHGLRVLIAQESKIRIVSQWAYKSGSKVDAQFLGRKIYH